MKIRAFKQVWLYNYRYWFAYASVVFFGAFFLVWQLNVVGPGLAQTELATAVSNLSLRAIIDWPVSLLHSSLGWLSFKLFDVSVVSIRLPSISLALATALLVYKLTRRWFGKPTALLTGLVVLSADWFLSIGRLGSGSIELSFWLALGLLAYTKLLERKGVWLVILAGTLGALLFVPFGPYVALALLVGQFAFGTFRSRLADISWSYKIFSALLLVSAVGLWVVAAWRTPGFERTIVGLLSLPSLQEYLMNIIYNTGGIVALVPSRSSLLGPTGVILIRFFELVFILFGAAMLWRSRINRLSWVVLALGGLLTVLSGFSRDAEAAGLQLVIAAILLTAGLRHLMYRWQRTFPKNPYARMAAFIPIGILLACVIFAHYQSYFVLWPSQSATHQVFSQDFSLIKVELNQPGVSQRCIVVSQDRMLEKLLTYQQAQCQVQFTSTVPAFIPPDTRVVIVPRDRPALTSPNSLVISPLVSETQEDNVRWLVVRSSGS